MYDLRMGTTIALAGASGYAGGELLRLLLQHPSIEIGPLCAGTSAGQSVTDLHPHLPQLAGRVFSETSAAALGEADLVFLALPHGESGTLAAQLPPTTKVIDLGADHRLTSALDWTRWYGGEHRAPWTYGIPELPGQRARIADSTRVANSGCYAAAVILALAPLVAAGAVDPADVVVVAASGTSGAGRAAKPNLLGTEVMGDLSAYKVGAHQHVPEIKQATGAQSLSFTPLLAPMPRGILATVTARPTGGDPREVLASAYADEPFVHLLPEGQQPHTKATAGSNSCHLQVAVDQDSGRVIVTSALDNLGKGAAGQALQCANLVLGLPEQLGLSVSGLAP
jgi:N-acetyl-gamma-glutamyl-phosphate reductase